MTTMRRPSSRPTIQRTNPVADDAALKPAVSRIPRLHPRLLLASLLVALVMLPVGFLIAALGVFVLKVSGGAASDTSLVVAVAGFLVADFWGGGIVAALTRARAPQVAVAWAICRIPLLLLIAVFATKMAPAIPVQFVLAVPAAFAGARVSRKQAALRRQIRAEQERAATRDATITPLDASVPAPGA